MAGPALARSLALRATARRSFVVGFVLGNLIPDADWVPLVMVYLVDPELAMTMHRGFTHSLLAAGLPALGCSVVAWITRDHGVRGLGWGLALGMLGHAFLDLLLWFDGVDLLWPLGYFGYHSFINLWGSFRTPPVIGRLLSACEYLSYSVFYTYLEHMARETERSLRLIPALQRLRGVMNWLTGVFLLLALLLEKMPFNLLLYGFWALAAFPAALYMTVRAGPALYAASSEPD